MLTPNCKTNVVPLNSFDGLCPESKVFQPPIFEDLLSEEIQDDDGNLVIVRHSFDSLLLNSERLGSTLGVDTARSIIEDCLSNLNSPSTDTSAFTDEQLLTFVKSRNIQSRSELQSWIDYIDKVGLDLSSEFKRYSDYQDHVETMKKVRSKLKDEDPNKSI